MREPAGTPLNNSWPAVCFNLVIDKNTALLTGSKLNTDRPKMSAVPLILISVNDTCVAGENRFNSSPRNIREFIFVFLSELEGKHRRLSTHCDFFDNGKHCVNLEKLISV